MAAKDQRLNPLQKVVDTFCEYFEPARFAQNVNRVFDVPKILIGKTKMVSLCSLHDSSVEPFSFWGEFSVFF